MAGEPADSGDEERAFDYDKVSEEVALEELGNMLLDLKFKKVLNATHVCILSFWAWKAGLGGIFPELGLKPNAQSGKFSEKFDAWMEKNM